MERQYPNIEPAIKLAAQADILLIIGTSLQVYPAASLLHYVKPNIPIYLVDPNPSDLSGVTVIKERASRGVPLLARELLQR